MSAYQKLAACFVALSVPVIIAGLFRFESNMEDVFQWLPDQSPERTTYSRFTDHFGTDDFLVVSWEGCKVDDSECDKVAVAIAEQDDLEHIASAVSGRQLITQLESHARLSAENVKRRFEGIYFGPDHNQTCVVVALTDKGMNHRRDAVAHVQEMTAQVLGSDVHVVMAGYPYLGAYSDATIRWTLGWLIPPSCVLTTFLAWYCLKSFRLTLITLAVAGLATILSVAVITLSGGKWGGLSTAIPTLTYILTVSGTLHLINYASACPGENLAKVVFRIGYRPCLISALTTAVGMLSLCRSQFPAVREFGLYCACGVALAFVCQLTLVPPALQWLGLNGRRLGNSWQDRLLEFDLRFHGKLVLAFLIGVGALTIGMTRLNVDLEVERVFSQNAPITKDIAWFETAIGPVEQTELVLTFEDTNSDTFHERVAIVRAVQSTIDQLPNVDQTLSLTDSLPRATRRRGLLATVERTAYRSALRQARNQLSTTPYLSNLNGKESWRISLRVPFRERVDFGKLSLDVIERAETLTAKLPPRQRPELWYTGVSHMYHVTQNGVVEDLFKNFALAFVLICPLMIFAVQSVWLGCVAMIPNIFPTVVVFGGLGLIGYPLDIGMTMTACVALGIAVDDTTHFLVRFRDGRHDGDSMSALQAAFRQCSTAMTQTTLIAGVGLAALLFGPLMAMTRFSMTLIALLTVALVCDLILLPALLKTCGFVSDSESTVKAD